MRLRFALVAAVAALASVLVAPAVANAAPDDLACSAAGSYSRYVNGVPKTFWLVGTVGSYRYWQVVGATTDYYQRSYVVRCSGGAIASSADLTITATGGDRCGTTTTSQYRYVGERAALLPGLPFPVESDYRYWHVYRWESSGFFGFWTYDHSELAQCPTAS
ncbi:hypothetical protein ACFQZ4_07590 [Catellatospora coxensis]|uniref:SH3 domain-containing protein n=1 Tax=Catellatospora coxensis TaxID=310354 RepID=A0A8J3KNR1_9ACTN|nr:hypothetical protein [Catellatospora coxensis]GIG05903.1 hypothetical protein Cco03nite_26030 [Catellatospora coxensis]